MNRAQISPGQPKSSHMHLHVTNCKTHKKTQRDFKVSDRASLLSAWLFMSCWRETADTTKTAAGDYTHDMSDAHTHFMHFHLFCVS